MIFLLSLNLFASEKLEKISLQLDWKFQFQHAGFIVAKEKGFYQELGLDVTLLEYKDGVDIEEDVISKKVDFGISNTPLMVKDGVLQPVVLLATYLQRSPLVFVTQPDIKKPSDLEGKRVMATEYEYNNSSLTLFMDHFFVKSIYVPHTYSVEEFRDKKIDAMSAFTSNELYDLEKQNIPYRIMDPAQFGFITNAMNLFTSYDTATKESQKIEKFLKATKKGWQYALNNTDEVIEIIHKKYNQKKSIEALNFEAKKIKNLMLIGLYDIGEISNELMTRAYKQLYRSGKALPNQNSKILIFDDIIKVKKSDDLSFTQEEKEYLRKKGTIKLCVDPDWMPFEGFKDGKYIGMIAEYFDLIRQKSDLNIEIYPTKSWDESMNAIKSKKCDIIGSASPTPERLAYMNFTDTYMSSPIVLVTKVDKPFVNHITDVSEQKLGITKGYAIGEILRDKYPNINIIDVDNIEDGLKRVESGELYGYIDNLSVTVANIQKSFHGVIKVSARLEESDDLTIGSIKDEPILNAVFQKVVHSIDKSKVRSILNKWISVEESVRVDYTFLWKIALWVLGIFAIIIFYNYQLRLNNKKLRQISREDALTKVGNRLKLNEILDDEHKYTNRYQVTCGVILLDIDDFKKVNDTYGHLEGDKVLEKFAAILSSNIRETDKLGRWGGEEFLIVCPNTKMENLIVIAEGLRENIQKYNFGKSIITASFGLSLFDGAKSIEKVLDEADKALYHAKSTGKNRVVSSIV
jgi:diguanylate cyclase (GGDEF)-like protein